MDNKKVFYRLKNVHKTLGQQKILDGLNLDIFEGETIVLIGSSGGGKSILLRHLIGLMLPDEGDIYIHGESIKKLNEKDLFRIRNEIGILFQHGALFDGMTVFDNVAFPLEELGILSKKEIYTRTLKALKVVELDRHKYKIPSQLSGGMKKRAALARAIVRRPKSILYDEPTAGLDPVVSDTISKLINHLKKCFNATSVVITHDMQSAFIIADRIAYLKNGKIDFIGTPGELKKSKNKELLAFIDGKSDIEFNETF